jgi:hypothetical protein
MERGRETKEKEEARQGVAAMGEVMYAHVLGGGRWAAHPAMGGRGRPM